MPRMGRPKVNDLREFRVIDEKNSETYVEVAVSAQFFAWVMSLGNEVKLTGPDAVVEEMKKYVEDFLANY